MIHSNIWKYLTFFTYIWWLSIGSDDDVCVLQLIMNTKMAPQLQLRGTESWTVGALEVSCCYHCRCCSAVSLSGSSEFLALSLFKVGSSSELQNWPVRESFIVRRPVHRGNPTLSAWEVLIQWRGEPLRWETARLQWMTRTSYIYKSYI